MTVQAVALRGPFTTEDLAEIADLLRRIDARNPTALFEFYAVDPDASMLDAKREMAMVLPPKEGRQTVTESISDKAMREAATLAAAIRLVEVLEFYGDPESYFGLIVVGDSPCGDFLRDVAPLSDDDAAYYDDFRDGGGHYGKQAREALAAWRKVHAIDE